MWYILFLLVLASTKAGNANVRHRYQNEDKRDSLSTLSTKPTLDLLSNSVKQKRCSYNLKSPADLKLHLEQKRLETLCKFCLKSDLHMKLPSCKKCENFDLSASISPYLLRNSKNLNKNLLRTTNKIKEKNTSTENTQLDELASAHLNTLKTNTNVHESLLRLMKSPLVNKQIMSTVPMSPATHTTDEEYANQLSKSNSWVPDNNDILGDSPSNIPSTSLEDDSTIQENNFELLENLRRKRLKDHLTHNDYLNILRQALQSGNYLHSIELQKRDSNQTDPAINKALKEKLLNDMLLKHVLEFDSSEEGINISEIVGSEKETTHDSTITKITTEKLTTEKYPSTVLQTNVTDFGNTRNLFGTTQQGRFNYKKHPREKLKFTNNEWIVTKEPVNNDTIDQILEKIAPNNINESQAKEKFAEENNVTTLNSIILEAITENSINLSQKHINEISQQTTKEVKTKSDLLNKIKNQHFINRHLYLKNPRLKSIYENGKHKYILTNTTNIFVTTESITTNKNNTLKANEMNKTDIDNLVKLTNPTKNTDMEIKKISTRSTKDILSKEKDKNEIITDEVFNSLEKVGAISSNKINKHEVIKKVLPINRVKNNEKQDIFSRNLNMHPKINLDKFKNISNKKNNVKDLKLDKNNPIKRSKDENNLQKPDVHLLENRINLPLILKQSEDGRIQLILDKTEICNCTNCTNTTEKYVFKRKTSNSIDDNLTKYPLNIFNILEKHQDQSSTHVNNYLQMSNNQNEDEDLKEQFYKYLINDQLYKLFHTLNIPVDSSSELHSYIDELPDKEKNQLNQYVLSSMSKNYINNNGDEINKEYFNKKQKDFIENLINKENKNNNIERTTESNRITFKIQSENDPQINYNDNNILRSFIQDEIQKQIKNTNTCPMCNRHSCMCNNDKMYFPQNEGRIIDKRHYKHIPVRQNIFHDQKDNNGIGTKYKIMSNFINWARDIVINNKTHH